MTSFTTEFGNRIDFVPGYFERNNFYADYARRTGLMPVSNDEANQRMSFHLPAKDWVMFSAMLHFMIRNNLLRKFQSGIDLGGAEATLIRLFRAAGFVEHSVNVDIVDFTKVHNDDYFREFMDAIANVDAKTGQLADIIKNSALWVKHGADHFANYTLMTGLHTEFPRPPKLDENYCMDALEVPGTYDLVTAVAVFDFFELDRAFAKLKTMLKPGGVFVGHLNYCWWPISAGGVVGHFPYAQQRLNWNDLHRYYAEHHPDFMFNLESRYNWFHKGKIRPTIGDWMAIARKHGLRPVAVERIIPKRSNRFADVPVNMLKAPWFNYDEVLRDIHCMKPGVTAEDLITAAIWFAVQAD